MNNQIIKIIVVLGLAIVGIFVWNQRQAGLNQGVGNQSQNSLKIISTKPHPLDEATILPNQAIEITLSRSMFRSELKHRLDPEVEHEIEVVNGVDKEMGQIFRIVFKKPLEMGTGYTLFILSNTHDEEGHTLDREYIYHFRTIGYRGI